MPQASLQNINSTLHIRMQLLIKSYATDIDHKKSDKRTTDVYGLFSNRQVCYEEVAESNK
jgi:hypothetical protein